MLGRRGFLGTLLALPLIRELPVVKRTKFWVRPTGAGNFLVSPHPGFRGAGVGQILAQADYRHRTWLSQ